MSLDDWHLAFVSVCLILVLAAFAPVAVALLPSRKEPFFALAVLGEEGIAESYYPEDDPRIEVGEEIHWTIYLHNHMGETQYIAVRVKLLGATALSPNSTTCNPSPSPVVYEVRHTLMDNVTWFYPFSWSIEDIELVGDFLEIKFLTVNGAPIATRAIDEMDSNFRLVFELWIYDVDLHDFRFGWKFGDVMRCAWNQIWFNGAVPE